MDAECSDCSWFVVVAFFGVVLIAALTVVTAFCKAEDGDKKD